MQNLFWGYIAVYGLGALAIILVDRKKFRQAPAVGVQYDSGASVSLAP